MRSQKYAWVAALLGAGIFFGWPSRQASACECVQPPLYGLRLPQGSDASTHSVIFIHDDRRSTAEITKLWLLGPSGPVEVQSSRLQLHDQGTFDVDVLRPLQPLAPHTHYSVQRCGSAIPMAELPNGCEQVSAFTTGNPSEKAAPPALPVVVKRKRVAHADDHSSSCSGDTSYIHYTHQWQGALLLGELDPLGSFIPETTSGSAFATTSSPNAWGVAIGHATCGGWWSGNHNDNEPTHVRFGVLNSEGTFSGWTEPEAIDLPEIGCAIGSTSSGRSSLFWALLAGMVWRRRRSAS